MENFRKLGMREELLRAIKDLHFEKPTLIQEKSIPLVLAGNDVIAESETGSGKTLAFGSVILETCVKGHGIQALVLSPTRELAEQITRSLRHFSKYKPLSIVSVYGGVAIGPQIDGLTHADIVVGTPGRILDHINRNTINLRGIKILVLDEADRMLDMGFIEDVQNIMKETPKQKQTLLFSATISSDIITLANRYMNKPHRVQAGSFVDPKKLKQVYYDIEDNLKISLLLHLLKNEHSDLSMVFCNTQKTTDFVSRQLRNSGINNLAIHGGYSQAKRNKTMSIFNTQKVHILICTDVAARGLDIKNVTHVYNYDVPKEAKQYIHRIGRTARAGKEGIAITLLGKRDHENMQRVLNENDVRVERLNAPYVEKIKIIKDFGDRERKTGNDWHRGQQHKGRYHGSRSNSEKREQKQYFLRRN